MYPFSQAYQVEEDTRRGDITFAVKYGVRGIKKNYLILFATGVLTLSYSFLFNTILATVALFIGLISYLLIWQVIKTITGKKEEYSKVMKTKYYGGIIFTFSMLLLLLIL
jgi:4-hydroxybenzoate polyprenyltransferase